MELLGEQPDRHATSRTITFLWKVACTSTHPLASATVRSRPLAAKSDPGAYSTFIPTARPWHRDDFTPRCLGRRPRGPANAQRGGRHLVQSFFHTIRTACVPSGPAAPCLLPTFICARHHTKWPERRVWARHPRPSFHAESATRRSHTCTLPECRLWRAR